MFDHEPTMLRARWQALREENPKLRIRDAANLLKVSEMALVALSIGSSVTRLKCGWPELISELYRLGPLMGLTRNDYAVHERHGSYGNLKTLQNAYIVKDDGFEAGLFFSRWAKGFAVNESGHGQVRQSLQFFDESGCAVHKIYLSEQSRSELFSELVEQFRSDDQSDALHLDAGQTGQVQQSADSFWSSRIVSDWPLNADGTALTDPDLNLHSAAIQADRLGAGSVEKVLNHAAMQGTPLVIVVGNSGAVQLHRGTIEKIVRTGPWINVLDDAFNLHLRDAQLASAWRIRELKDAGAVYLCWGDERHRPVLQILSWDRSGAWEECVSATVQEDTAEGQYE